MKVDIVMEINYNCVLSAEEADYIRGLCQNYLGDHVEPEKDHELRVAIFTELQKARTVPGLNRGN